MQRAEYPRPSASPRAARSAIGLLVLLCALFALVQPACASDSTAPELTDADALVARTLSLADQRLALMPAVAAAKWRQQQPIGDPAREALVIQAAADRAARAGLARAPVAALFAVQIRLARASQDALFQQWQQAGFDAQMPALSLAGELRPRIDRLTADFIEALYLAAPSLAVDGAVERYDKLAATLLPVSRWSPDARAELLKALVQVRFAAPRSLARARAAGVLRIGTPADYAPFSLETAGKLEGSDIELANELAQALGLKPVFVRTSWKTLLADLAADRFDLAVGGIAVTPARQAVAGFSLPLAHGGKTALGRCDDRARFTSLEAIDQPGVRVIENAGGTNEAFARAALHRAALGVQPDNRSVPDALLAGRADVMFTDDTEVALIAHRQPRLCRLLPQLYAPADKAFLLPREPEWASAVNAWLAPQIARGEPARLLQEYLAR